MMNKIIYIARLCNYYFIKIIILPIKLLVKLPLCPNFFREILAAYSVGAGTQAFQEKKYNEAYKILRPIVDYQINDAYVGSCQYIIGVMYYHGLGVNKDIDVAIKYLKNAKEKNNDDASSFLNKIVSANN